jgi:hypothetical protein
MIDEGDCGAIGGIKIGRGNRSTRRKPAPTPLCPTQIPHDQTRDRTRAAAVGNQRLTAWAMARPLLTVLTISNKEKRDSYEVFLQSSSTIKDKKPVWFQRRLNWVFFLNWDFYRKQLKHLFPCKYSGDYCWLLNAQFRECTHDITLFNYLEIHGTYGQHVWGIRRVVFFSAACRVKWLLKLSYLNRKYLEHSPALKTVRRFASCFMHTDALNDIRAIDVLHVCEQTNKLWGFSPQANYTDRATAACRPVPTLANRGCRLVSATNPHGH